MTKVISFISRKGGTGKTTNAINLATWLAGKEKRVVLIETDINYTLNALRKEELKENVTSPPEYLKLDSSEETSMVKMIKSHQKDGSWDYIIVDSAGNTSEYGINRLGDQSNVVIIPTSLGKNDVMVTKETIKDVLPAINENGNLRIVVLPVRVHSRTKIETVQNALSHLDVEIMNVFVPARKVYTQITTMSATDGYEMIAEEIIKLTS